MRDRIQFVQFMAGRKFGPLASINQFRAIEGTMDFFLRRGIAGRGTWMSIVNAAAVEAIQRGAAISLGESQSTGGNPATLKWADYFDQRKGGGLVNRDVGTSHRTVLFKGLVVILTDSGMHRHTIRSGHMQNTPR